MKENDKKRVSKFLSLVLRHRPDHIDLRLNDNGWAQVDELLVKAATKNVHFTFEELENIVATNDKQRFAFNADKTKIRANQGHSIPSLDLQLEALQPPAVLFHGTVEKFMASIQKEGLKKRSRQHVHLSEDQGTASKVGSRRGEPIILNVKSGLMFDQGFTFFKSLNGVWLTDHVPAEFITVI